MALAFTLVDTWEDGQRIHIAGTVAASGNYSTGGDTLDPFTVSVDRRDTAAHSRHCLDGTALRLRLRFYPGSARESSERCC